MSRDGRFACWHRPVVAGLVGLGVGLVAAGCGAPRGGYATTANVCAPAFAAARDVVHNHGRLVQVRPLARHELGELFPGHTTASPRASSTPSPAPQPTAPGSTAVPEPAQPRACLIIYQGPYAEGSLVGTPAGGKYAIIAVNLRPATVIAVSAADVRPSPRLPSHSPSPR